MSPNPKPTADNVQDFGNTPLIFSDALIAVEKHGSMSHLVFGSAQRDSGYGTDGKIVFVTQLRLVVPTDKLQEFAEIMFGDDADVRTASHLRVVN